MEMIKGFEVYPVEFSRDGNVFKDSQVQELLHRASQGVTDVLVISHGWNNDNKEAKGLYTELLGSLRGLLPKKTGFTPDRTLVVMTVYWPSKRFADHDLIPGGGAASAANADAEITRLILELIDSYGPDGQQAMEVEILNKLKSLVPQLEENEGAQEDFVRLLRSIFPASVNSEEDVLQDSFFAARGPDLLLKLGRPFRPRIAATGGATSFDETVGVTGTGGAAGFGNLFGGIKNGALNFLNLFTYYEMKERAGNVGSKGVRKILEQLGDISPPPRLHLCGHSFGGRVVSAAVCMGNEVSAVPVNSVVLLQAAFSHWGFAERYDGTKDGLFRTGFAQSSAQTRLKGPVLITYTPNDRAVGLAYPIASRLRNQVASGIGDANDPYGGIGRNGAQRTPEAADPDDSEKELRDTNSPYGPLKVGKFYNLEASKFIADHGDIRGPQVAHALLSAMLSTS
ncbi:MAG: hypothetical protein Q8K62_12275 [Thiobacillus sp.]|nr:hypothetical protein [Thiobacillus sp.]